MKKKIFKRLIFLTIVGFASLSLSASDLGMKYKSGDYASKKTGLLLGIGIGNNHLTVHNKISEKYQMVDFNYKLGISYFFAKSIGIRTYISGNTSFNKISFYGYGGLNLDLMYDILQSQDGFGFGIFSGLGVGNSFFIALDNNDSTKINAEQTKNYGILINLDFGVSLIISNSSKIEFAYKMPLVSNMMNNKEIWKLKNIKSNRDLNLSPHIISISYTKVL